jgi:hypothetical protein
MIFGHLVVLLKSDLDVQQTRLWLSRRPIAKDGKLPLPKITEQIKIIVLKSIILNFNNGNITQQHRQLVIKFISNCLREQLIAHRKTDQNHYFQKFASSLSPNVR